MNTITFSGPIHTGMDIIIANNSYRVFTPCIFLPTAVMGEINKMKENLILRFSDSIVVDKGEEFLIESNLYTTISYKNEIIILSIEKKELIKRVLDSFKCNSLGWVVGPNFNRIMKNYPEDLDRYWKSFKHKQTEFINKINMLEDAIKQYC